MHDIWNPWHGCVKCSEGCENCYMYFLDEMRDNNGRECAMRLICNGCSDCGRCWTDNR